MASIDFEAIEYIDEIKTEDLQRELQNRKQKERFSGFAPIRETIAELTSAFYARNADRFETLCRRLDKQVSGDA